MAVAELDRTQVVVAPGQASIQVGKGRELFENSDTARQFWADSERLLGYPLSELALFGKVNGEVVKNSEAMTELTNTENAQPTVVITSLAELAVLEEHGLLGDKRPYWNSGHSVGLVVALMTSGALDAEGALKLADARRKAFKYAIEHGPEGGTGFLAVQHDKPEVVTQYVEYLTTKYPLMVCLDNYDNQVILGGKLKDLDEAMSYVREQDPRMANLFRKLPVEAAYHSPYMKLAEEMFGEDVDKIDMQDPTRGVLVAGSMVDDDGTVHVLDSVPLIKTALTRQPTHTERWRPLMKFLRKEEVSRMLELNEAPSLTSWNNRMFGGDRNPINFPGVQGSDGKDIAVAWTWDAPVEAEVALVEIKKGDD